MNYLKFKFEKMKRYNFNIKVLMFFLLSFLTINKTYATHIIGGDITYRYISGNQYEITLTLRRDCALGQVGYDNPASLGIFSGANNTFIREVSVPFNAADTVGNTIDNACGIEGFGVCVQSATYKTIVDLPSIPGGYIIAYQRCCRNSSLNNVNVPLESGSTEWIAITEESMNLRNSSPRFILWPDVYVCANKPLIFNHSATDIDGDSLVYKICTPFDGATIQFPQPQPPSTPPYNLVQFKSPYSLNDMMGGTPLKIDPISGTITANPNLVGQFLIGICVEEYRNGQLLSTVRRDFQYNVRVCLPPVVANFSTVNNDPCDSLSYAFTNNSENGNSFEWNFNFPSTDPNFISTEQNPTFKFSQSGTYKVRLLARSSTGACDSSIIREIVVRSGGNFPESAINKRLVEICSGSSFDIFTSPDASNQYIWTPTAGLDLSNPANPKFTGTQSTKYQVTITNSLGCSIIDSMEVRVTEKPLPLIISGNRNVCEDGNFSVSGGFNNFEWSKFADFKTIISSTSNLDLKLESLKTKIYVRSVNAVCGNIIDSLEVTRQLININLPPLGQMCSNSSKSITVDNNNPDHTLSWTFNDSRVTANDNIITVKLSAPDTSSFNITGSVQNQFGCKQDVNIQVDIVVQKPLVLSGDTNVCGAADLNIAGGTNNFEWSNSADFNTIINSSSNLKLKLDSLKTKFFVRSTNDNIITVKLSAPDTSSFNISLRKPGADSI
jgi:PKD repeat protein